MSKLVLYPKSRVKFLFLFVVLMLAFNYPILSIFNIPQKIAALPLLYLYIFGVWLAAILLIAIVFERHPSQHSPSDSDETPIVSNNR